MSITPEEELELKRKWTEERIKSTYVAPSSTKQYIATVLIMTIVVVGGVASVEIFSPEGRDTAATITQIIAGGGTFTAALLAYMKSQETHAMVNSGLHEWIDAAVAAAFSAGEKKGTKEANKRTDELAAAVPVGTVALQVKVDTGPLKLPLSHDVPKDNK